MPEQSSELGDSLLNVWVCVKMSIPRLFFMLHLPKTCLPRGEVGSVRALGAFYVFVLSWNSCTSEMWLSFGIPESSLVIRRMVALAWRRKRGATIEPSVVIEFWIVPSVTIKFSLSSVRCSFYFSSIVLRFICARLSDFKFSCLFGCVLIAELSGPYSRILALDF